MASSVRVEDDAFADERYTTLARVAGLADADHARGKMLRLWRQCTIEHRYSLAFDDVVNVLGERGVDALVAARLGVVAGKSVRIRGTKGRIEWRERLRENGRKGGRPKRNRGKPLVSTLETKSEPPAMGDRNPPAPAPAPAPAQGSEKKTNRGKPPAVAMPSDWEPNDTHRRIAAKLARDLAAEEQDFRDKAAARGYRYVDWDAAFCTWLRNEQFRGPSSGQRRAPQLDAFERQMQRVAALEAEEKP